MDSPTAQSDVVARGVASVDPVAATLGRVGRLRAQGSHAEALALCNMALTQSPGHPNAQAARGNALMALGRYTEAALCHQELARRFPDSPAAWGNLGNALRRLGSLSAAIAAYDRALLMPNAPASLSWNRTFALLLAGDYDRGFAAMDTRFKRAESHPPAWVERSWDGRPLPGGRLLVFAEQGLGDILQFVRFLPLARARVAELVLVVSPRLHALFANLPGVDKLLGPQEAPPAAHARVMLMSLPTALRLRKRDWIGQGSTPCLKADPARVERWAPLLRPGPLRVGIAWQGNPDYDEDHLRSPPLSAFSPLAQLDGVRWLSLQKHHGVEQLVRTPAGLTIEDLGGVLDNEGHAFVDTAAALQHLDLVITSDSALAHLSGSLGCPTFVVLPFAPDWRWGLGLPMTPWYRTVRLFRQPRPHDWAGVFEAVTRLMAQSFAGEAREG
jgi:tetratricopeptide (TPR) repeat protein